MVIMFPAVPETVKVFTVVVEESLKSRVWGGVSTLKSLKVLFPVTMNDPVPAPVNQMLL
jgi:hypothetical protein